MRFLILPSFSLSFKFHRLFPLSQYDLPTHNPNILSFATPPSTAQSAGQGSASATAAPVASTKDSGNLGRSSPPAERAMTQEQIARNPGVDYTRWVQRCAQEAHSWHSNALCAART